MGGKLKIKNILNSHKWQESGPYITD